MKKIMKTIVNSICLISVSPLLLFYYPFGMVTNRDTVFSTIAQLLSLLPGISGSYLRKAFYRLTMTRCDSECVIFFGTLFSQVDTEIGRGVYIGPNCNIGRSKIGDHCTLGSNVHILSGKGQHKFESVEIPIQEQGGIFEKISIGEDTWIGNSALIMANIGKKCIIGAGSVVTKEVEAFSIVAGNPARLIRKRI
ncbi:MAG: acyltransferase [Candidatus Scalindua sp. AMX11]|nr:MAG: acyltransferase [Candidatus Scalindua sp.]NOG82711.1 acyltransferase [Planctomycetota bacterium]RZV95352.1 MAG: acyltransferase [Candidatus Scalindua sp. SCAELEC01]TDE66317.1 MAG: acyltransferase [Candidatus Scalindua sp. AMX11]